MTTDPTVHTPGAGDFADLYRSAIGLSQFEEARVLYPSAMTSPDAMSLRRNLVSFISDCIRRCDSDGQAVGELIEQSIDNYTSDELKRIAHAGLAGVYFQQLDEDFNSLSEEEKRRRLLQTQEHSHSLISQSLREALEKLHEMFLFQCLIPEPTAAPEFSNYPRIMKALKRFWSLYAQTMLFFAFAPGSLQPSPIGRLLTNLRERCSQYLDLLGDTDIRPTMTLLLQTPLDELDGFGDEYAPSIAACTEQLERATLAIGISAASLTPQESMFVSAYEEALQSYKSEVKVQFSHIVTQSSRKDPGSELPRIRSAFEYQREVETVLRKIAFESYKAQFGKEWLDRIRIVIGEPAYQLAESKCTKAGAPAEDLLHFLEFYDLNKVMIDDWNVTGTYFSGLKRDYNTKMSTILAGRVNEAHHRPSHLWTDIERQRFRVACDDILKSIRVPSQ